MIVLPMISAVVLTHNSAATLSTTLKSLGFADELLVIDDHSTDETTTIAKSYGAQVTTHTLSDDFALQRNLGLQIAKGDWVLYVDSDEEVSESLAKELIQASRAPSDVVGYMIKRTDKLWGKVLQHGETDNVRLMRFAKKDAGVWVRPVHEVWQVKGLIGNFSSPLLHTPHPTVSHFLASVSRYSTVNAQYLYRQNTKIPLWHVVAYPVTKFLVNYVWRLGFLDGTQGAIVAIMMSFHSFLVRSKLWLLTHASKN